MLQIAKNITRKARSYMRAYTDDSGGLHVLIEKFVTIKKCHRNMLDLDPAYLDRLLVKIEQHATDMMEEQASLAAEKAEVEEQIETNKSKIR